MTAPRSEQPHPVASRLDGVSTLAWAEAMVADHGAAIAAVRLALPEIARLADRVAAALRSGGRLVLAGAGTSGRLAALEAAECPPTFGSDPDQVLALLAGGQEALWRAVEGAEDDERAGANALEALPPDPGDIVVGLSASGSTRWVRGVLAAARAAGCGTAAIVGNSHAPITTAVDLAIVLDCGPEVVAGSTRLKAGSAQKLALNVVTTSAFRALGRVREGRMVGLRATNRKLHDRALAIVVDIGGVDRRDAARLLDAAGGDVAAALAAASGRPATPSSRQPPADLVLRPLRPADARLVDALAREPGVVATTAPFADLGGAALFANWLARPGVMLGAFAGQALVGAVLATRVDAPMRSHVLDIGLVAVADAARGAGVGDLLIRATLDAAVAGGVRRVELRVWPDNVPALRLYERHGFEMEGRLRRHAVVAGVERDALVMGWLAPPVAPAG